VFGGQRWRDEWPRVKYDRLTADDEGALADERAFLPSIVAEHYTSEILKGSTEDLRVIQLVLDEGPYTEFPGSELVALGTAFGDVLAQEVGLHWVRYTDEEGTDLALRYRESSIVVFPRSMILKRLERGEGPPDLTFMFEQLVADIHRLASEQPS